MKYKAIACAFLALITIAHAADTTTGAKFPLRASANGRYLVDAADQPFFYHADTVWLMPRHATLAVAEEYLDQRVKDGFTALHIHAVSKENGPVQNMHGEEPFAPLDDILKPNEAYWRHLDAILAAAEKRGLAVAISALWIRWGGDDKHGWRAQLTDENARAYGRFLGARYAAHKNLIWIVGGDANPKEKRTAVALLAQGLKDKAPHHLLTVHNAPEHSSAAFFADEPWLDLNAAYTYREVHPHVLAEWSRPFADGRPRPIFLAESCYERETMAGGLGTPFRVRREAYGALLSGALAGHAYGHHELWTFSSKWREAAQDPGFRQMRHVRELFATRAWWKLAPEPAEELIPSGRGERGKLDHVSAARAEDGTLAIVYIPQSRAVTVDLARLSAPIKAQWFDPTDGSLKLVQAEAFSNKGHHEFMPPEKNASGESDWVLLLEAAR